ncbi:MAG: HAMP domain-containing sensor histidine kinase [Acidobacteriota bacterium]
MSSTYVIEQAEEQAAEKARGELVEVLRILAHKLSQPLTCLRGSVEVALMGELKEPECRRVLEQSLEESYRMAQTLETLRDVLEMEGPGEDIQPVPWKKIVGKLLEEAASAEENCPPQLICDAPDEVWVKASTQQLDTVTRRLLSRAIREASGKQTVRMMLSTYGETACLSICDEGLPSVAETMDKDGQACSQEETLEPDDLEWWMIRRAIGLQGGRLEVDCMSNIGHSYKLYLPLAFSGAARQA